MKGMKTLHEHFMKITSEDLVNMPTLSASVAETSVNIQVIEEISSKTLEPILYEPSWLDLIISFVSSLF